MKFIVLIFSLLYLCADASSDAISRTVYFNVEDSSKKNIYSSSKVDDSQVTLELKELALRAKVTYSTANESFIDNVNVSEIPDSNIGEYDRIQVQRISDVDVLLTIELAIHIVDEPTGKSFWAKAKEEVEAKFINSNWNDFISNKEVQIKISDSGKNRIRQVDVDLANYAIRNVFQTMFETQFPEKKVNVLTETVENTLDLSLLTGTLDNLKISSTSNTLIKIIVVIY